MSEALAIVAVLLVGAAAWRTAAHRGAPPALPAAVVWGGLAVTAWLAVLQLAGVRWSAPALAVPVAAAAIVLLVTPPPVRGPAGNGRPWAGVAAAAVAPAVLLAATAPVGGWDFRYIWGLKARAFALAGAHDPSWLAWPGHAFAHPDYPPLWPDLLAAAALAGGDATRAAALWHAVVVAALAAACWWAAGGAPARLRALAAVAGGWTPVMLLPAYAGYAEPLLALAVVVALATLRDRDGPAPPSPWVLAASIAALSLVKNEGTALAVGIALAGAWAARGRDGAVIAAGLLPAVAWHVLRLANGIPGEPFVLSPAFLAGRLGELPAAFARTLRVDVVVLLVAWGLALVALGGREERGVRIALAVWGLAALATYIGAAPDLAWRLEGSLDRVLVAPLPATIALALGSSLRPRADARPESGSAPGAAPSA
ncbi:MAG: hypothetical protein HY825_02115 [Acidobacteria bacterium]|nr:hypothetical protein [Acidobacteriota bacterium]